MMELSTFEEDTENVALFPDKTCGRNDPAKLFIESLRVNTHSCITACAAWCSSSAHTYELKIEVSVVRVIGV
jgi:hypothetical protein